MGSLRLLKEQLAQSVLRVTRPRSVRQALSQVVSPRVVAELARDCEYPGEVLERVAQHEGYSADLLLAEVAELLGVATMSQVHLPSVEMFQILGLPMEELRGAAILPQRVGAASAELVIALSDIYGVPAEILRKYRPVLVRAQVMRAAWVDLSRLSIAKPPQYGLSREALVVLQRLSCDAKALGAEEVFVGSPEAHEYEFFVRGQAYRGSVFPELVGQIAQWLGSAELRRLAPESELLEQGHGGKETMLITRCSGAKNPFYSIRLIGQLGR